MKKRKNRGFEIGTLIFWLAIFFLIVSAFVYKNIVAKVKNAPKDRTPNMDALLRQQQKDF